MAISACIPPELPANCSCVRQLQQQQQRQLPFESKLYVKYHADIEL